MHPEDLKKKYDMNASKYKHDKYLFSDIICLP